MEGVTVLFCVVALAKELPVHICCDFVSTECAEIFIANSKDCLISFHVLFSINTA